MCGIAGFYCFGEARPILEEVQAIWKANEYRGKDAAGLAYINEKGESLYFKQPGGHSYVASQVADETWAAVLKSHVGIFHTRQATQGDPKDGENNHPVIALNWLITHNGIIGNDDDLWAKYGSKYTRPGEVDSSAINLVLGDSADPWSTRVGRLGLLMGSAAFAGWYSGDIQNVLLGRTVGSPLYIGTDRSRRILFWSSVSHVLDDMCGKLLTGLGKSILDVPDRTAFVLSQSGTVRRYGIPNTPFRNVKATIRHPVVVNGKLPAQKEGFSLVDTTRVAGKPDPVWQNVTQDASVVGLPVSQTGAMVFTPTPYGMWCVSGAGKEFRAHRRIRTWWNDASLVLPASDAIKEKGDCLQPLEAVRYVQNQVTRVYQMCPWCGIMATLTNWDKWGWRCAWCEILSVLPKAEGE